jgi:hypothetical protein
MLRQSRLRRLCGLCTALLALTIKVSNVAASRITIRIVTQGANRNHWCECCTQQFQLRLGCIHLLAGAPVSHAPQMGELQFHLLIGQTQGPYFQVTLREILLEALDGLQLRV